MLRASGIAEPEFKRKMLVMGEGARAVMRLEWGRQLQFKGAHQKGLTSG